IGWGSLSGGGSHGEPRLAKRCNGRGTIGRFQDWSLSRPRPTETVNPGATTEGRGPLRSRRNEDVVYCFTTFGWYPGEMLNPLTSLPSANFQTRTSPSHAPAATRLPSGLIATAYT